VLTYTTGQREHFYSPLYDRGEIEDVFSIHTDGEDIWDRMPQSELEKLERILAGEAEAFTIGERITGAGSIPELAEIDCYVVDMETSSITEVQRKKSFGREVRRKTAILQKTETMPKTGKNCRVSVKNWLYLKSCHSFLI